MVDEAQDLSPAHWMLLRAMAAPGPDDMFLAGDTHQRIYDSYVSLGSLGIAIRGRSTRLTLSYRSTHEILAIGVAVPERRLMPEVENYLNERGVLAASIGADGPRKPAAVHVGTLHRFKGLEY